jgi:hypothetical protein
MANKKQQKKKRKLHLTKWIVPFVIISIFTFTGLAMYVQIVSGIELSASLITCFFAFCTGELWMLASIKKTKINNNFVDDPSTPEDESVIYSEIYNQGYEDAMKEISKKLFNSTINNNDEGGNGIG